MELRIKELAAYMPYGLKCKTEVFGDNEAIVGLEGLNDKEVELSGIRKTVTEYVEYNEIKPILYPLDFLTKEITHNGEKFVPVNKLFEHYEDVKITKFESNQTTITATYKIVEDGDVFTEFIVFQNTIVDVRYWIVETLLEWKLDVFKLIENNLAISVTEEFNPYK